MAAEGRISHFYPGFQYRDAEAAMKWIEEVLGAERREDRDPEGNLWSFGTYRPGSESA